MIIYNLGVTIVITKKSYFPLIFLDKFLNKDQPQFYRPRKYNVKWYTFKRTFYLENYKIIPPTHRICNAGTSTFPREIRIILDPIYKPRWNLEEIKQLSRHLANISDKSVTDDRLGPCSQRQNRLVSKPYFVPWTSVMAQEPGSPK